MAQSKVKYKRRHQFVFVYAAAAFVIGCTATVPQTARVQDADLPDYKVGGHQIEEEIDLYIEPRIQALSLKVKPRSNEGVYHPIPVVVGPALEKALLEVTRQHFSKVTIVSAPENRPTLSYELLTYKPVVSVVPGMFSTRLNISARMAMQVSINSANGEQLFSATAIGTSHVTDTKIAAADRLKDGSRLLEVATRDAIIDAMYDISSIFGNSSSAISDSVRISSTDSGAAVETMDDVVLHLRTWRENESGD